MFNKILVVCVGNICRSPMAEAIFQHRAQKAQWNIQVSSAGIGAMVGHGADTTVQELLLAEGIQCSLHRARQINEKMVLEADLILVMEHFHRKEIQRLYPAVCGKVHLLGKWGDFEIPDPYKKPKQAFENAYQLILQGIEEWQLKLMELSCCE